MKSKIFLFSSTSYCLLCVNLALAQFEELKNNNQIDLPVANSLDTIIQFSKTSLVVILIGSLLLFLISGIYFITAGGDEGVLETAHGMWQLAIFGLAVALIGYVIINLIKLFV